MAVAVLVGLIFNKTVKVSAQNRFSAHCNRQHSQSADGMYTHAHSAAMQSIRPN